MQDGKQLSWLSNGIPQMFAASEPGFRGMEDAANQGSYTSQRPAGTERNSSQCPSIVLNSCNANLAMNAESC